MYSYPLQASATVCISTVFNIWFSYSDAEVGDGVDRKTNQVQMVSFPSYPIKCKITGSAQNWTTICIIHGKASAICVNTFLHTHILIRAVKAYVGYIELDLGLRFTFLIPHQCAISQRLACRMQVLISRWQRSNKSKYKAAEVEKSIIVRILEENLKRKRLFMS